MFKYIVKATSDSVIVSHKRLFLIIFGFILTFASSTGLLLVWLEANELFQERVIVAAICFFSFIAGLWCIFRPYKFQATFIPALDTVTVSWRTVVSSHENTYELNTLNLKILEEDNDGYWYTPEAVCKDGSVIKIGFGTSNIEYLNSIVNEVNDKLAVGNKDG